jgi:hypothetical protein
MSHLSHEALWAYAANEGGSEELAKVKAHLEGCADCAKLLAQVTFAQGLLKPRGAPPPLSDVAARRIGAVLAEAAEAQAISSGPSAWFSWWKPLAFAAVAALLLFFLWPAKVEAPAPVAEPEHKPLPLDEPQGEAQVTSARKARGAEGALAKNQALKVGSNISTEAGGALCPTAPAPASRPSPR